jgi:hypothetical protein
MRRSFLHDILISAAHFSGTGDSIIALISGVRKKKLQKELFSFFTA